MLLFEHSSTPEGQLVKRAMRELKELRAEIAVVRAMIEDENLESQSSRNQRNSNSSNNNYRIKFGKRR